MRQALVDMLTGQSLLSDTVWQTEPAHDPSPRLRNFTALRDRTCDGPTQSQTVAARCDDDHDLPHPDGPTAAWNLASRARRTHQLKHYGWTPVRTGTSTIWTSPAGQVVEVPNHNRPAPGIDCDPTGRPAALPDPDQLAPVAEHHPWLPAQQHHPHTDWTIIDGSDDPPPF